MMLLKFALEHPTSSRNMGPAPGPKKPPDNPMASVGGCLKDLLNENNQKNYLKIGLTLNRNKSHIIFIHNESVMAVNGLSKS